MAASRPKELDAEIKSRVQEGKTRDLRFARKDKKTWFKVDLAVQVLNAVWRAYQH